MIELSNGHKMDFLVSSGALGFDGKGYLWEWPFRWFGFLRPEEFTVITKTLTYFPREGNLNWWRPWNAVKFIENGIVNSVGLTNPGIKKWIKSYYPKLKYKTIVSICPFTTMTATSMAKSLDELKNIVGIEVNLSCPATEESPIFNIAILNEVVKNTRHPVIVKLGHNCLDFLRSYLKEKVKKVEVIDIINSVPWKHLYPDKVSPIRECSGVSGGVIKDISRNTLAKVRRITDIPIISGGGIDSIDEVFARFVMGARAVSFGSLFLYEPWEPNRITAICRRTMYGRNRSVCCEE